jgi:hypothetical protein
MEEIGQTSLDGTLLIDTFQVVERLIILT